MIYELYHATSSANNAYISANSNVQLGKLLSEHFPNEWHDYDDTLAEMEWLQQQCNQV